ncbi:MAG: hypothetical protein E5Y30_00725 [Mesorhizobium sp.]|nr:MAG: hypothetical protein E5Y30_00725 [Mesorhizobium sp.]
MTATVTAKGQVTIPSRSAIFSGSFRALNRSNFNPPRDEWPKVNGGPGVNGFPPTSYRPIHACNSVSQLSLALQMVDGRTKTRFPSTTGTGKTVMQALYG